MVLVIVISHCILLYRSLIPCGLVWIEPDQTRDCYIATVAIIYQTSLRIPPSSGQLDMTVQSTHNCLANVDGLRQAAVRIVSEQLLCTLSLIVIDEDLSSTLDPGLDLCETLVLESNKHISDRRMIRCRITAHVVEYAFEYPEHEFARFLVLVVGAQEIA